MDKILSGASVKTAHALYLKSQAYPAYFTRSSGADVAKSKRRCKKHLFTAEIAEGAENGFF